MNGGAKGGKQKQPTRLTMNEPEKEEKISLWQEQKGYGGLDWASQKDSVVGRHGQVREDFEIEHSALGWKKFRERLRLFTFCHRDQPGSSSGAAARSRNASLSS